MQQTKEHLMIINILGIKNVIIAQTKVDIVGKEAALKHAQQIRDFVKGSTIENAPIVPVMPNLGINIKCHTREDSEHAEAAARPCF